MPIPVTNDIYSITVATGSKDVRVFTIFVDIFT